MANQHHPTQLPMLAWRANPTDGESLEESFKELGLEEPGEPLDVDTAYAEILKRIDIQSQIVVDSAPITR